MEEHVSVEANRLYSYSWPGIGLELACTGGLLREGEGVGEISLKRDTCNLHLKTLLELASVAS